MKRLDYPGADGPYELLDPNGDEVLTGTRREIDVWWLRQGKPWSEWTYYRIIPAFQDAPASGHAPVPGLPVSTPVCEY